VLGVLIFAAPHILTGWSNASTALPTGGRLGPAALVGIEYLLLYIPVMIMMEEVAFRGAIDSHVRHPGESHGVRSTVYAIVSAIVVSVLWGIWHYPIIPLPPASPCVRH
jgi:hypothetical protein